MPYANNEDIKIYYQIEGTGPDLILTPGLSSSSEDWRELGYVAELENDFRLILVDPRGHGKSDKPYEPKAYSPEARVKDCLAILDDLGVKHAHYWGYSSGGVAGFCAAKYAPDRFKSVIIGGVDPYPSSRNIGDRSPPLQKAMQGLPEGNDPIRTALDQGGEAWLKFWDSNATIPEGMRSRMLANDYQALVALWEQPFPWRDEVEPYLSRFPFPGLIYAGEGEHSFQGMKFCSEEMPRAEFVALPGFGHFDIWFKPDKIISKVKRFLAG